MNINKKKHLQWQCNYVPFLLGLDLCVRPRLRISTSSLFIQIYVLLTPALYFCIFLVPRVMLEKLDMVRWSRKLLTYRTGNVSAAYKPENRTVIQQSESKPVICKPMSMPAFPKSENVPVLQKPKTVPVLQKSKIVPVLQKSQIVPVLQKSEILPILEKPQNVLVVKKKSRANRPIVYHCNRCGKGYQLETSLKRHLRLECGVEPQQSCDSCGKKFIHKFNLNSHLFTCKIRNTR